MLVVVKDRLGKGGGAIEEEEGEDLGASWSVVFEEPACGWNKSVWVEGNDVG